MVHRERDRARSGRRAGAAAATLRIGLGLFLVVASSACVRLVALLETRDAGAEGAPLVGNTFYVATTGDDANPGTQAQPWRTVQKAVDRVTAGDTIILRGGTYAESVTISRSGANGQPITLTHFAGEVAVLDGGATTALLTSADVSDWVIQGLTVTSTSRYTLQLGWWGASRNSRWTIRDNHIYGTSVMKGQDLRFESNDIDGVYPDGTTYGSHAGQGQGDAGVADIDGSHHNTIRANRVHDFSGANGRGIWTQGYTHDDLIEGNTVTNVRPTSGLGQLIDIGGSSSVGWSHTVRGNEVRGCNYVGIQLENTFASTVENNIVQDTGSAGLILINYDAKSGCPAASGSIPYGDTNNDKSCKDELTHNVIRQNVITTSAGWDWGYGGIMNWGARGVKVLSNTIYSASASGSGGINYQDPAKHSDGAVVQGNIIASGDGLSICSLEGFAIFAADDHNLLFNGNTSSGALVYGTGSECKGVFAVAGYQTATGKGQGSLPSNPSFKATGSDFHLQPGSLAIDASIDLGLTTDLEGVPRPQGAGFDMGAYEHKP
jgi:parallel beta-helix repeat protein